MDGGPIIVMSNRLSRETSPYLLQHADNPVDWRPWGEEAFAQAQSEDKPIFLSIGYSTCHWCHVMERESFEDEEVAEIINRWFIPVKVDREERPDVDHIYMTACQLMTGQGGWPLTAFLTPQGRPFFVGTYFPKESRAGLIGLKGLLLKIADKWKTDRRRLLTVSGQVMDLLGEQEEAGEAGMPSPKTLDRAYKDLRRGFDPVHGGFTPPPEFPTPHNLMFLLRRHRHSKDERALEMVETTLRSMYRGGIYDHIGFGFARYSTDGRWLVPHFEKMLYDNALLALALLETHQVTGEQFYAGAAREVFRYVEREMTSPEGGSFSAQDSESEGKEGLYYLWSPEEVRSAAGPDHGDLLCDYFNITESQALSRPKPRPWSCPREKNAWPWKG